MYRDLLPDCQNNLNQDQQEELNDFGAKYKLNKPRYDLVSKSTNVPSILIAAIHWRESSGDFTSYLSQGDPLGTRTWANGDSNNGKSLPEGTPNTILLSSWEEAAIFALDHEVKAKEVSGISADEESIQDMLTFSIYYNGLGYKNRGVPDPYTLSGTIYYKTGKFDSDGHYNPNDIDEQLGILVLLRKLIEISV